MLEQLCRETYGIMIYQEQVMQAAQSLAGYSLGSADLLRRAMGKKKPEEMRALAGSFIKGCAETSGIPRDQAERIFNLLAKFAGYGFNKSHAAGYACLSYITGFLKANHPVEFIAATLASEIGDSRKLAKFIHEARHMGIEVLRPDVNLSRAQFAIENGRVRFALAGVRHVGSKAAELVVEERDRGGHYAGLLDFLVRNRGTVNRKSAESLIQAGAFDEHDPNRSRLLAGLDLEMARAGSERMRFAELQTDLFAGTPPGPAAATGAAGEDAKADVRFDTHQLLTYEKQAFGFYFSSHPLEPWLVEYRGLGLVPTSQLGDRHDGDAVTIGGVITARRMRKDKRDRQYVIVTLEDFDGAVEVMVFADQLEKHREQLHVDRLVIIQGRVRMRDEAGVPQLWADRVWPFEGIERQMRAVVIDLPPDFAGDGKLLRLRELAAEFPGEAMLYFRRADAAGRKRLIWVKEFKVLPANRFVLQLRKLFGDRAVELRGELPPPENEFHHRQRRGRAG
jgi:DNA polymerase-3 subunit alpha